MKKTQSIALLSLASLVIFGFFAAFLFRTPGDYSDAERRSLAQMPAFDTAALASGRFMEKFEQYSLDQFPLRERLRTLKAVSVRYLFRQKDDHGLYTTDGHLCKLEYPLSDQKVSLSTQKLREVYEAYLRDSDCKIYLSVVPDKNYFLAPKIGYPAMDYEALVQKVQRDLDFATYIDIFGTLSAENYYKTDPHWKQETLLPTAQYLAAGLGVRISTQYTQNTLDIPFYGVYVGQSALPCKPDTIRYLTSDILDGCTVTDYDAGKAKPGVLYDREKAAGKDPYELFLMGANPLITVENPNADGDRELILFRDSFGSSLAPLLVSGYSKITLVDLRYIRSALLGSFIDFQAQDVLLLYSTTIFNNNISM